MKENYNYLLKRALGCILYEIFTGNPPFYTNNLYQLVDMIVRGRIKITKLNTY